MGKITLYHPIPLSVIRGAVEYCGWRFSTIKQIDHDPTGGKARYTCRISRVPSKYLKDGVEMLKAHLQQCFMDDIKVAHLRRTKGNILLCDLHVQLPEKPIQRELRDPETCEHCYIDVGLNLAQCRYCDHTIFITRDHWEGCLS